MLWHEKFRINQEVKVVKRVSSWTVMNGRGTITWNRVMDKTINKVYKIKQIDKCVGYQLDTYAHLKYDYWYPLESLACICVAGKQLLFNFMED